MDPEPEPDASEAPKPGQDAVQVLVTDLANKVLAVKEGETFLYSDTEGNLDDRKEFGLGFYHRDTRFLSRFIMKLSGADPVLLSSSSERAYMAYVDLTNTAIYEGEELAVPQQTLNVRRIRAINGRLFERVRVKNYNPFPVGVDLEFSFGADFNDIFEVRGLARESPGQFDPPKIESRRAEFGYHGRDGVHRSTVIEFSMDPTELEVVGDLVKAKFRLRLGAYQTRLLAMTVEPIVDDEAPPAKEFDTAVHELRRSYEEWERQSMQVVTDNELFNTLIARGLRDLRALYTKADGESLMAAGVPWYVAMFGRDALIASHQLLMVNPEPARNTLLFLAERQGTKEDPWRDEEPGRILHEVRRGELAGAGLIPHTPYYGTVDATPLWLIVFAQHFRWTGDLEFAKELLPAAQAALDWIDRYGDRDGDGFVEYLSRSPQGMRNQGWKDSGDSVVHADGRLAEPPIALAEVQAYVYMAKLRVADVFEAVGEPDRADALRGEAEVLRRRFNDVFWMDDENFFAGALDRDKRQVRTIVSNPGHGLYCDIVDTDKAAHLARRLLAPDMFSGWGIRTMSKSAAAYNPMSYHNGTVWPHDNAFIAAGLKRYAFVKETNRVATAMFDAAIYADYMRLPELFCGFTRRTPNRPVSYPVACSPQAWAAGAPYLILQAMLGISARAHENLLTVNKPHLPPWLNTVELRGIQIGDSKISLVFRREGEITGFSLLSREGDVRVIMEE